MEYYKRIDMLKDILESLKEELSEYPSFEDIKTNKEDYALLIAIESYLEFE